MINCDTCGVSATEVYLFQMSVPFWERPRIFRCRKCGGSSIMEGVLRLEKQHIEMKRSLVALTQAEIDYCRKHAQLRREASRNFTDKKVSSRSGFDIDFTGLIGEVACMKYFGFPTHATLGTFRAADLPHNIEVRTRTMMWHDLKVEDEDDDSRRVVLAIATDPKAPIKIAGWIMAIEGKTYKYIDPKDAGLPFHSVPKKNLRNLSELSAIIEQEKKISSHK
jgi:hypothetical protein